MTKAIYPGSFDPLTNGHMDIINRALKIFDFIIIAISNNKQKTHLLSLEKRMILIKKCINFSSNVKVSIFDGLLVDYAKQCNIKVVLRGLRAISDFEYEFQLANMNRKLCNDIETVFMMTGESSFYVSSKLVKEVASFGSDISSMVPNCVAKELKKIFS